MRSRECPLGIDDQRESVVFLSVITVVREIRKSGHPLLPFLRFGFIARNQLPLLVLYETTDRLPLIKFDRVVVLPLAALSMKPPPPPCCHPVYALKS